MKLKKVFAVSVIAAAAVALTACSNNAGQADGKTTSTKTTITWAVVNGTAIPDQVIAAFEKEHSGIHVEATSADTDTYQTLMRTQLSAGTAPDVLAVFPGSGSAMSMATLAEAGLLYDLSDQPLAENITEGNKSVATYDGKTYIAVSEGTGVGAAYNMTALDDAGLTAPTTWSELLKFCDDARGLGKSAFALAVATDWNTQLIPYALTPTLVYGPNPEFASEMTDGKATFADSAWKESFDKYLEMQDRGCFQDGDLGTVYEDALDMVAKGTSFGSVQVAPSMSAMQRAAPDGTEFSLLPLPATDDASETRMAVAAGASNGVNAKTKNVDAALEFINFLGSDEGQTAAATADSGVPATPNDLFEVPASLQTLMQYAADGKTTPFMDQLWPNPKVQQVHLAGLQSMLGGSLTPEALLKQMDAAYQEG